MREIKFRAWDGEKMWDNPYHFEVNYLSNSPMPHRAYNDWCDLEDGRSFPCILMQYTGLKDKNGKEIYESDIVRCDGKQRTVKWANGKFWFLVESSNQHEDISEMFGKYYNKVEVIGNCYETPDLL